MSKYCVVRTCKARAALTVFTKEKIIIHKFPQEEYMKQKWELFVNYANRTTDFRSKTHCVCSRHFHPSCYFFGRLRSYAVPTIVDRFTPETALQYRLIPNLHSKELDALNDYSNTFLKLRNCETYDSILRARLPKPSDSVISKISKNACVALHCNSKNVKPATEVLSLPHLGAVAAPCDNLENSEDVRSEIVYAESGCFGVEHIRSEIHEDEIDPERSTLSSSVISPSPESSNKKRCLHNSRPRTRKKRTTYCGNLSPSDFSSPSRSKMNLVKFQEEFSIIKNRLRVTNQRLKRANLRVDSLQSLLDKLHKQTSLKEEDFRVLKSYGISTSLREESKVGYQNHLNAYVK